MKPEFNNKPLVTTVFRHNLLAFVHLLRAFGFVITIRDYVSLIQAMKNIEVRKKEHVHIAFAAIIVKSNQMQELFDQCFDLFWREHQSQSQSLATLLSKVIKDQAEPKSLRRIRDWVTRDQPRQKSDSKTTLDQKQGTQSSESLIKTKDFEALTFSEYNQLSLLLMTVKKIAIKSYRQSMGLLKPGKIIDWKASLHQSAKRPDWIELVCKSPRRKPYKLIWLLDVSGSMESYLRAELMLIQTIANAGFHCDVFFFSTELKLLSLHIKRQDIEALWQQVSDEFKSIGSGTQLASCLESFNQVWLRRLQAYRALFFFVSDGLGVNDKVEKISVQQSIKRIKASVNTLVWLNPLFRYKDYQPQAGVSDILDQHIDHQLPMHDWQALLGLLAWLSQQAKT